jgi:hypothetical protein
MTGLLLDTQLNETQHEWLHLIEVSGNALLSLVSTCTILALARSRSLAGTSFRSLPARDAHR